MRVRLCYTSWRSALCRLTESEAPSRPRTGRTAGTAAARSQDVDRRRILLHEALLNPVRQEEDPPPSASAPTLKVPPPPSPTPWLQGPPSEWIQRPTPRHTPTRKGVKTRTHRPNGRSATNTAKSPRKTSRQPPCEELRKQRPDFQRTARGPRVLLHVENVRICPNKASEAQRQVTARYKKLVGDLQVAKGRLHEHRENV